MSLPEGELNLQAQRSGRPPLPPDEAGALLLAMVRDRAQAAGAAWVAVRDQQLSMLTASGDLPPEEPLLKWLPRAIATAVDAQPITAPDQAPLHGCVAVPLFTDGAAPVGALVLMRPRVGAQGLLQALGPFVPMAAAWMGQYLALVSLGEQAGRLMDLARASGDWMWETDEHARYRWISGDFERMTGLQAERCVGELVPDEQGVDGVGEEVQPPLSLRQKLMRPEPFARFASCLPTPGGPRYISRSGQPVFDAHGVFCGFRGTARDVTARKQAQQTLRERAVLQRQVAEAERSSREKSEFMSRISHELRTPLNAIVGFGQLMAMDRQEPLGPAQRTRLEGVQQAGQTLLTLIDALLQVAQVDGPSHPPSPPASACAAAAEPALVAAPVGNPANEARRHVLYVEDEPLNVVLMQEIFRGQKAWTLHVARDGAEGVELAREVGPDLALIDMNLPDFNGIEVLRRLRAEPALKGLRCIALSADAMAEQISAAREAGFDDYWTKPIDLTRLLAAIAEALSATDARPA